MQTAIFIGTKTWNAKTAQLAKKTNRCALCALCVQRVSREISLEQERRVGAAEAEGIRQRVLDGHRPRLVGHVVEVALLVRLIEVDRGGCDLMVHCEHRDPGLQPTRGAQQLLG